MYLRKSRADEEAEALGEMETLARHEQILSDLAEREGIQVSHVLKEIATGDSIKERVQMQFLMRELGKEYITGVIVFDESRLTRGETIDQGKVEEAFKYSDTLIITPTRVFDPKVQADMEYLEFGLFMSRKEYEAIKRRLRGGVEASAASGNYLGTHPPYGYKKIKLNKRNRTLEIIPEQAETVRMMFGMCADGKSLLDIRHKLHDLGIKSPNGLEYWDKTTIRKLLQNDVYIGKIHWGRIKTQKKYNGTEPVKRRVYEWDDSNVMIVDGKHEPIIDDDTFYSVRELMKSLKPKTKRNVELRNQLAGLLKCARCGQSMAWKISTTNIKSVRKYGVEPTKASSYEHRSSNHGYCHQTQTLVRYIVEAVADDIERKIGELTVEATDERAIKRRDERAATRAKLAADIAREESKYENLFDLVESGEYTKDEFRSRKFKLTERISAMRETLEGMSGEESIVDNSKIIVTMTDAMNAMRSGENPAGVNAMLKTFIERIEYDRQTRYDDVTLNIVYKVHPYA